METGDVTPIQSKVAQAVREAEWALREENQALRRENLRLRAELDMAARLFEAADKALREAPPDAGA